MKIYEYKYRNSKLPDILKKINNNYDTISKANRTYNKFFYFDIVDFDNSLVYTLNNNQDAIVSHMHLFKVKPDLDLTIFTALQFPFPDITSPFTMIVKFKKNK